MSKRDFWYCNVCRAQNHVIDGECQYCECQGLACKRDNCSDPKHFAAIPGHAVRGEEG